MTEVAVLTLNTWKGDGDYQARMTATVDLLRDLAPDILLLQEVFAVPAQGISTATFIADALGLAAAYAPAREKIRRFEGADVLSQSGLAVLTRGEILSFDTIPLPEDPRDGDRIAQVVTVSVTPDLAPVTVINLHLTHLRDAAQLRETQFATALRALAEALAGPVFAGGDFNTVADDAWLARAAEDMPDLRLVNLRTGPSAAAPTLVKLDGKSLGSDACLDHLVWVGQDDDPAPDVTGFGHYGDGQVSDHRAVMARVKFAASHQV